MAKKQKTSKRRPTARLAGSNAASERKSVEAFVNAVRDGLREHDKPLIARHAAVQQRGKKPTKKRTLPADIAAFLVRQHVPPQLPPELMADTEKLLDIIETAFLQGCWEGYIEGRIADLEPRRQHSRKMTEAKRKQLLTIAGMKMTMDERNRYIVEEYPKLKDMLGSLEAQHRLAVKYGLESREHISRILAADRKRGRQDTP